MKSNATWKSVLLLHPLAFVISPVLSLLAENYGEIQPALATRSFLIVIVGTLMALAILGLILRDAAKAAALVSLGAVLFFSYGHLYASLETVHVLGLQLGRHRHLLPLYGLLFLAGSWVILRREGERRTMTLVFSVAALAMLLTSAGSLATRIIRSNREWSEAASAQASGEGLASPEALGKRPDIYYIILDGYARSDVMKYKHGFNNSNFLQELEDSGFVVAEQSSANFMWTSLSLSSSLNMRFVQDLGLPLTLGSYPAIFAEPIQHSLLRYELERLGYTAVAFETGYLPTEVEDADYYFQAATAEGRRHQQGARLNAFETLLANSSGGLVILDALGPERLFSWFGFRSSEPFEALRTIILDAFDNLEASVGLPSPKFVFAHIIAPHNPYFFDREGNFLQPRGQLTLLGDPAADDSPSDSVLYRDQAYYITTRIQATIDYILAHSEHPPIIIVQSDHGPGFGTGWRIPNGEALWQRMAILNLYYLPYGCDRHLYPTISPVNSFRLVLSCYFGLDYPLVEDKSFFTYWPRDYPYDFFETDVAALQKKYPLPQ